jgi:hypothetical protein
MMKKIVIIVSDGLVVMVDVSLLAKVFGPENAGQSRKMGSAPETEDIGFFVTFDTTGEMESDRGVVRKVNITALVPAFRGRRYLRNRRRRG